MERNTEGKPQGRLLLCPFETIGQRLDKAQRGLKTAYRLGMGRPLNRLLARSSQILHGFADVVAARVMIREMAEFVASLIVQLELERLTYALV